MSEKKPDVTDPAFWRDMPMNDLKGLLKLGLLIATDKPGVYYLIKEITLPNAPEGSLPA